MVKVENLAKQKSLAESPNVSGLSRLKGSGLKAFFRLGNVFLKRGKINAALSSYYEGIKKLLDRDDRGWKSNNSVVAEFIINDRYNFIYCPIAKVASSSMKKMAIELSELKNKAEVLKLPKESIHAYVSHNLTLAANYNYQEAMEILADSKYFKFVIVRNPWERLASAYLNKFVWNRDFTKPDLTPKYIKKVIADVYKRKNLPVDYQKSITFREFIDYICVTEDDKLNGHWCPQYLYLGNIKYDFIAKVENLDRDFESIKEKLQIEIDLPWSNQTKRILENSQINYSEYYPLELNKLEKLPGDRELYTTNLIESVRERYQKDIQMFGYNFTT